MKIKKKDMRKDNWNLIISKRYIQEKSIINGNNAIISLNIWNEVNDKYIVHANFDDMLILDNGYKWLQIATYNENYWVTAMYDNDNNLIQIYFDITLENNLEDISNPYFYDLFVDISIHNNNIYIIDEDELYDAFKENIITNMQYELAIKTLNKLYNFIYNNKDKIINYCYNTMLNLEKKIKNGGLKNEYKN